MYTAESLGRILPCLQDSLKAMFGAHLKELILFGSCARGEADPGSDVDLLILVDLPREETIRYRRPIAAIAGEVLLSENVLISPILENQSFFEEHSAVLPFYQNILREGVRLSA